MKRGAEDQRAPFEAPEDGNCAERIVCIAHFSICDIYESQFLIYDVASKAGADGPPHYTDAPTAERSHNKHEHEVI